MSITTSLFTHNAMHAGSVRLLATSVTTGNITESTGGVSDDSDEI